MIHVGLVGLDGHQGEILNGIASMDYVRLAAVASEQEEKLKALRRNGAVDDETTFYTHWRELLDKEKLDILGICSINSMHAEQILAAAERGIHVCAEKPLTVSLSELEQVKSAVEKSGIKLTMLLTMRFLPQFLCVRQIVQIGEIGEVVLATAQKSYKLGNRPEWMRSRKSFGGTIPFVGIHALDLIRWTTGREFVECMAYHGNTGHPDIRDMEDNASVLLKFDNGGSATVRVDYCRPPTAPTHGDDRLRIAGTEGVLEVKDGEVTMVSAENPPTRVEPPPAPRLFPDFVQALKGEGEHLISQEDVFRITEVSLKAREAADQGKIVRLV